MTEASLPRAVVVRDGALLDRFVDAMSESRLATGTPVVAVGSLYDALAEVRRELDRTPSTEGGAHLDHGDRPSHSVAFSLERTIRPTGKHSGDQADHLAGTSAGQELRAVREAFRRLDPSVRLVVVAPRGTPVVRDECDRVVEFDPNGRASETSRSLVELANALEIAGPMAEESMRPSSDPAAADESGGPAGVGDASGSLPMPTERRPPSGPPTATALAPERDVVDLVIGDALQAFAARARKTPVETGAAQREPDVQQVDAPAAPSVAAAGSVAPPSPTASDDLGDVDLVEAVRLGGELLLARAITIIRSESGTADVRFVPEGDPAAAQGEPVVHEGRRYGALLGLDPGAELLRPWADWLGHWLALDRDVRQLEHFAFTDDLTEAGNRRSFDRTLDDAIADARRDRRTVTLMFFDIDDFKLYNDRFGHEAGDAVLRETVALLRAVIRRGDRVFRVGGDEFVVLFADHRGDRGGPSATPRTPGIESVETITQRFRERIASMRLSQLGVDAPGTIGISAGVATFPWDGHDARSLLRHADELALQSKRSGKNAVTFGPGAKDHCCGS